MANSRQATKRARQADKRRLRNTGQKSAMRTTIKTLMSLVNTQKKDEAKDALKSTHTSLDRLAGKGKIHPNKAARLKSRLNKKVKEQA